MAAPGARLLPAPEPRDSVVHAVGIPNPFTREKVFCEVAPGKTLAEILLELGLAPSATYSVEVYVGGSLVFEPFYSMVRPKPGTTVVARLIPHGARGKAIFSLIIGIGLAIFTAGASFVLGSVNAAVGGSFAAGAISKFTVGLAGASGLFLYSGVRSLVAPPPTVPFDGDIPTSKRSAAILGEQNLPRLYEPIVRQYGRYRRFPSYAAKPYTETVGEETYLRALFDFGYGPLQITDLRIGDTPIDELDADYEIHPGYDDDDDLRITVSGVDELALTITLEDGVDPGFRTTEANTHEVSLDIVFPGGLIGFTFQQGAPHPIQVDFTVEYREATGPGAWTGVVPKTPLAPGLVDNGSGDLSITGMVRGYIARGIVFDVPTPGTYDVRVLRTLTTPITLFGDPPNPTAQVSEATWAVLRSLRPATKPPVPNLALVEVRLRMTDQLAGGVRDFNALAESILPVWSGSEPLGGGWGPDDKLSTHPRLQVTRNHAWALAEHLRGRHNRIRVPYTKLDTASIAAWASANDTAGRTFDAVVDFEATIGQVANDICASGRAALTRIDGRYGVVVDEPKPTIITHLSPRDTSGFRSTKVFRREVHALRVGYINATAGYQPDEVIVYADGYDEGSATEFDRIDLWGVTDPDRAWRDGRYHMATALLRPELYSLNVDVQNLMLTRGDRFKAAHDVMLVGVLSARIKTVSYSGSNLVGVVLDELVDLDPATSYGMLLRTASGETITGEIVTPTSPTNTVVFAPFPTGLDTSSLTVPPAVQDLVTIGEFGVETGDYLVHALYPGPDLSARIEFVDYAAAVFTADTETIPPYNPGISDPRHPTLRVPAVPTIDSVASDESVLVINRDGTVTPRILLGVRAAPGGEVQTAYLQAQFRTSSPQGMWSRPASVDGGETQIALQPVDEGIAYDVRVRAVSDDNRASVWRQIDAHTVVGAGTPPPDVEQLLVGPEKLLVWQYPDPPRDLAGFRIKHQAGTDATWQTGIPAHDGIITATQWDASLLPAGPRTIMLKAVDLSGNESATPAVVIADLGGPAIENIVEDYDIHAGGFVGTKTDCTVDGISGDLVADTEASAFWRADTSTFFKADAELFWDQGWKACSYVDSWEPDSASLPGRLQVQLTVDAESWQLEYRVVGDTTWIPWPGFLQVDAVTDYEFQLSIDASAVIEPRVTEFVVLIDVADREEFHDDFVIASSGTVRVTPDAAFRAIKQVLATIQDDGNNARSVVVYDKDATNGPEVRAFAADGTTRVAALVDFRLRGY